MDEIENLNDKLDELKKEDIGIRVADNPWHKLWLKIIQKINSFPTKLKKDENLKNLVLKFKERFEETNCNKDKEGTACYYINKGLDKLWKKYKHDLKIKVPSLIELASRKVPAQYFKVVSSEMMLDPRARAAAAAAAAAREGGKKRKTKKNKKSKKVRKKYKRKTRKGGAQTARAGAEKPTTIPSLALLSAKKMNNKKDLQFANSLQLGNQAAEAEIERKLKLKNDQENARRASEQMRRQYHNLQLQNQAPSVAYSNQSVSRQRTKKKVEGKPKKRVAKKKST